MALHAVVVGIFAIFIAVDTANDRVRLFSALGIVIMIIFGAAISKHPGRIVWRHVTWGIALQIIFGLLILRTDAGSSIFECFGSKVIKIKIIDHLFKIMQ